LANPMQALRVFSGLLLELSHRAVVAEWLRRLTRNQFPSGSAGSNPADCDTIFIIPFLLLADMLPYFGMCKEIQHRWFSGRMLACHAGGPGSIPGRCKYFFLSCNCALAKIVLEAPGIDPGTFVVWMLASKVRPGVTKWA
jgi:hypothetical protein